MRRSIMVMFLGRSWVQGFHSPGRLPRISSALSVSFFDELQKNLANTFATKASNYYTIGITGAGGLVGTALRDELRRRKTLQGKTVRVVQLQRGDAAERKVFADNTATKLTWNPNGDKPDQIIDSTALAQMDAIVHLSGENIATGLGPLGFLGIRPWTDEKKAEIINSRVTPTMAIAKAVASCSKPQTLLVAGGIGAYGNDFISESRPAADESTDTSTAKGFLAQVSNKWEAAATPARNGKNRVGIMRFGIVMSTKGGALSKLYPIFFVGGGGVVGSGDQYFSFISARDHARAIVHVLETPSLEGVINLTSPNPVTNYDFTQALGKVMNRPTIVPFPSFAVSLLFGEMGEETLLGGNRIVPTKLLQSGFRFLHPTIEEAIQSAIDDTI